MALRETRWKLIISFLIFSLFQGVEAAIDCSRANTPVQKIICSSSRAAQAEERMARAYHNAVSRGVSLSELNKTQKVWKRQIRDICNTVDCVVMVHEQRIAELQEM